MTEKNVYAHANQLQIAQHSGRVSMNAGAA